MSLIENKILKDIKFALMSKNVETANKLRSVLSTFNDCKSKTSKLNDDVVAMEMCIAELTGDGNFELAEIAKNYVTADARKILVEKYADDILNDKEYSTQKILCPCWRKRFLKNGTLEYHKSLTEPSGFFVICHHNLFHCRIRQDRKFRFLF